MDPSSPAPLRIMDFSKAEHFGEGLVLLVDKPLHWTSFDVVNKLRGAIRGALGYRKIKVGHAGTLDPLASGVLVVCTGKATKRISELQAQDKEYTAIVRLGATTACLDAELPVDKWVDASGIALASIQAAADKWAGNYLQMPPAYSAKKVDGQKAYAVARKGGEINLRPAPINVSRFEVESLEHLIVDGNAVCDVRVNIACTKGTYIRAMARDLGETLGVGGHLVQLKRTLNGPFELSSCQSIEQILEVIHGLPPLVVDL